MYKDRGEAELSCNWLYPFIDALWLEFLGFIKYDSRDHPYLVYYTDQGIRFIAIKCDEIENMSNCEVSFNWGIVDISQKP
ncbi:hypothetical protein IAQ67_14795 [Paenibacillus peoriae]|uniref:Uncharacterized protein n=1 Tax=Paenibacillus peoriae TaxID=59893 RepID=A0A7H0Y274_9BACL|nr:hypothetical protein IAQ67_14795 [Paenibacillus peoriae]